MRRMWPRRARGRHSALVAAGVTAALALVSLAGSVAAGTGVAAAASTTTYFPSAGSYAFTGHGSGHGHGMSQWGAYGAATEGLNADQILDFYYPGTTKSVQGNPLLRVRIMGDEGIDVHVVASTRTGQLSVTDHGGAGRTLVLPASVATAPVTDWRSYATGTGTTVLQGFWAGSWQAYPVESPWTTAGSLGFTAATGRITLVNPDWTQRDYAGSLLSVPAGAGLFTVNDVPAEDYLRSVVPAESPSSWPAAALQAQAVAARTYAASVSKPSAAYDICDTTACQVYHGLAAYSATGALTRTYTAATTDAAVTATAARIRTYGGSAPAFTQFSASDGGWTVAGTASQPYLAAKADPYDGAVANPAHSWTKRVSATALGAAFGVGVAQSVTALGRDGHGDWGGRVTDVRVVGTTGAVTVSGATFSAHVGLRSTWWTAPPGTPMNPALESVDLTGIVTSGTGSGRVEVHTMSAASNYAAFSVHAATPLAPADTEDWRYVIAPYAGDGRPDLYAVHLRATGSGKVEVHVLSAASGYRQFVAHIATLVPQLPPGQGIDVRLAPYAGDGQRDLYLIPWQTTASGRVQVQVLAAATRYGTELAHATLPLPTVQPGDWTFLVGDGAGRGDIVAVHHGGGTGSGRTEVHVLSAASGWQGWSLHAATPLALQPAGVAEFQLGDTNHDGTADLAVILRSATGSGRTEIHVLDGSRAYGSYLSHIATALAPAPPNRWAFSVG